MPENKRQHFLPVAYLKYFSVDQANCTRKSLVWRFDGVVQRLVPVVSQCSGDYLYSKENAAQTERAFQRGEDAYCRCIDKLKSGKPLNGKDYGDLILVMFDFHLRNAVHKNLTGKEGIDAYNLRNKIFMGKILLGMEDGEIAKSDVVAQINRNWGIQIVSATSNAFFITSDHPSIWTLLNVPPDKTKPELHIVTLPLTPKYLAVAFNKRVLQVVSDKADSGDRATLNGGQIENGGKCIYSSNQFTDEQMAMIKVRFAKKTDQLSEVFQTIWKFPIQHLPPQHHFSFIRLNPPLF